MKKSVIAASVVLGLLATPAMAEFNADNFSVNVGAISVMPDDSSSSLNVVESLAGLPAGTTGVNVNTNTQLGLTFDYKLNTNWTLELVAATPFSHDVYATGALAGLKVGKVKHLPPTLLAQYHFDLANDAIDPFVGFGVNYTTFFDEQASSELVGALTGLGAVTASDSVTLALKDSWGYALQAGVNVAISDNWGLHFMVSKMDIDTDADVRINNATAQRVNVDIDPYVAMAGIRYRF